MSSELEEALMLLSNFRNGTRRGEDWKTGSGQALSVKQIEHLLVEKQQLLRRRLMPPSG